MRIRLKIVARELVPGVENVELDIEGGATVRDFIELCASRCGGALPSENQYKLMYPLFEGKPVTLGTALTQDGTLHICRIAMGG